MRYAKIGAVLFGLWGVLHIVGAGALLVGLSDSVDAGYAFYRHAEGSYPPAAGAILGYNAFAILWIGVLVVFIAARFNWRNDPAGAYANVVLAGLSDLGLIAFLLVPGFVAVIDALPGIALFILATLFAIAGRTTAKATNPA